MTHENAAQKSIARQKAREALRTTSPSERHTSSSSIRNTLADNLLGTHTTILAFAPLPLEPDLLPLITRYPKSRFAFPRVTGDGTMSLHVATSPYQLTASGSFIPEPDPRRCPVIHPAEFSLALIPGLAFDPTTGRRLGHGGGFYDRLLANPSFTAKAVGVAFACQLSIPFPTEAHDQPVTAVVSERGLSPLRNM